MTKQTAKDEAPGQTAARELQALKTEIARLAAEIRDRVDAADEEARQLWASLDLERSRFMDGVEQAAGEVQDELRQVGTELKTRLASLRRELMSEEEGLAPRSDNSVVEAGKESFPASDPPSFTPGKAT
jgi:phage host-nuclease inhibitor protein Gam